MYPSDPTPPSGKDFKGMSSLSLFSLCVYVYEEKSSNVFGPKMRQIYSAINQSSANHGRCNFIALQLYNTYIYNYLYANRSHYVNYRQHKTRYHLLFHTVLTIQNGPWQKAVLFTQQAVNSYVYLC